MSGLQGHTGRPGKVIGGAQRQQHQAGLGIGQCHRLANITQSAIAATGNQPGVAALQRLAYQTLRIPGLPGQPHRQFPPRRPLLLNGSAHVFVERLLAVQNQKSLTCTHIPSLDITV